VPVADNVAAAVPPGFALAVSDAVFAPAEVGANLTVTMQLAPPARVIPLQPSAMIENCELSLPPSATVIVPEVAAAFPHLIVLGPTLAARKVGVDLVSERHPHRVAVDRLRGPKLHRARAARERHQHDRRRPEAHPDLLRGPTHDLAWRVTAGRGWDRSARRRAAA
jgi:hypothetical protein